MCRCRNCGPKRSIKNARSSGNRNPSTTISFSSQIRSKTFSQSQRCPLVRLISAPTRWRVARLRTCPCAVISSSMTKLNRVYANPRCSRMRAVVVLPAQILPLMPITIPDCSPRIRSGMIKASSDGPRKASYRPDKKNRPTIADVMASSSSWLTSWSTKEPWIPKSTNPCFKNSIPAPFRGIPDNILCCARIAFYYRDPAALNRLARDIPRRVRTLHAWQ